jgi:hypothetical protein
MHTQRVLHPPSAGPSPCVSSLSRTVGGFGALAATRTTRARRPKTFLDIISIRCFDAPGTMAARCVVIPHVVVVADMLRPPRVFF